MMMKTFVAGDLEDNNYLLIDKNSTGEKEAVLIDCTEANSEIEEELQKQNAKLKYILLTHGHFDHILGCNFFREKYGCQVLLHKDDKDLAESVEAFSAQFGLPASKKQTIDEYFDDTKVIQFGQKQIKIIHTPGHTKGGVCFLIENHLFTGDTIFKECVGRTDLPGGSFSQLKQNIEEKLFTLDENIIIYPGHGQSSSIGWEKQNNKFL